jgi:hypothetical protein
MVGSGSGDGDGEGEGDAVGKAKVIVAEVDDKIETLAAMSTTWELASSMLKATC